MSIEIHATRGSALRLYSPETKHDIYANDEELIALRDALLERYPVDGGLIQRMNRTLGGSWGIDEIGWHATVETMIGVDATPYTFHAWNESSNVTDAIRDALNKADRGIASEGAPVLIEGDTL